MASLSGAEFVGIIEQMDAFVRFVDLRSFQFIKQITQTTFGGEIHQSSSHSWLVCLFVIGWWG